MVLRSQLGSGVTPHYEDARITNALLTATRRPPRPRLLAAEIRVFESPVRAPELEALRGPPPFAEELHGKAGSAV
jgi:hypothetical protein